MIGGKDIVIPCADPAIALDIATRAVIRRWRDCVVEDGETGDVLPRHGLLRVAALREILISKTPEASRLWDEIGACEQTNGTLIHLLAGRATLTIVVDDEPTPEMHQIVDEVRRALRQDLFSRRGNRSAA